MRDSETNLMRKFWCWTILIFGFSNAVLNAQTGEQKADNSASCVKGEILERYGLPPRFVEAEKKYCAEIEGDGNLQAIYGFVKSVAYAQIVRVYKDKAVFTFYEDEARYRQRDLTGEELETLRKRLAEAQPEKQPPLRGRELCVDDCYAQEFVSINRAGGRRVHIFASSTPAPMNNLQNLFDEWQKSGKFKIHYYLQDKIKDLELLLADDVLTLSAVWKKDDDVRVLTYNSALYEENRTTVEKFIADNNTNKCGNDYGCRWQIQKRRDELNFASYKWRKFKNGKLGEAAAPPFASAYLSGVWDVSAGGYQFHTLLIGNRKSGLFKIDRNDKAILIKEGDYPEAAVSSDARWLIAAKKDGKTSWESLVRINLATNEETAVNLELSSDFDVIGYVQAHDKFLVRQQKWVGFGKDPLLTSFLINAKTGEFDKIEGDFIPLLFAVNKPLQPTKNPNLFWAAKHDYEGNTQFGLYDTKSFTFESLAAWSGIEFDSDKMWVDETELRIYFVYRGHLLALPLPQTASSQRK